MPLLDDLLSSASQALGAVSEALGGAAASVNEARRAPASPQWTPATTAPDPGVLPNRTGFVQGIPPGGFGADAAESQTGAAQNTTRAEWLQCLWEEYIRCPPAWMSVNAIARTVTAGGLVMKWDSDTGSYGHKQPPKPAAVLAMERLIAYCNPEQDIRQLSRNVVADLQVFGGAMVEVGWFAGIPVALWNQDFPTTIPDADEHGNIKGYKQVTEDGREAAFKPDQIIHITLDSARPSVFGISPTHAAEESIVAWMFLHACEKESARRGLPPDIHADLPPGTPDTQVEIWQNKYAVRNIGPANIGTPKVTKGGGKITELQKTRLTDILQAKKEARDEVIGCFGVPPAKLGIIESGNLGGGTGSDQNRTYMLDVIQPVAMLIAEKLQFALAVKGFGVTGWHVEFPTTDYRDEKVVEDIRDERIRNGTWTINRARAEAGEPPVPGGDDPVIIARQDIILVSDLADRSKASIAALRGGGGGSPGPSPADGTGPSKGPGGSPGDAGGMADGAESLAGAVLVAEVARFLRQRSVAEHTAKLTTRQRVHSQMARSFPPKAIKWVTDPDVTLSWDGPVNVPSSLIDTDDEKEWNAAIDRAKVARIKKHYRKTGRVKPAVLVRAPGADKDLVVDGHHHALAMMELGHPVRAYVAHVASAKGPWRTLSLRQHHKARESDSGRIGKNEAGYAPSVSPGVRCGTCEMLIDNRRCSLVQGDIDPGYVCSQWQAEAPPSAGVA